VLRQKRFFVFFYGKSALRGAFFFYGGVKEEEILEKLFLFSKIFCLLVCFNFLRFFNFFFLLK